jgi:glycosyltransferase involved in cell wall biosynthesis
MRIAMIAPIIERVPPVMYGGIERVVATLTDELVLRGHDVTLFASGDSKTRARLCHRVERAVRFDPSIVNLTANTIHHLAEAYRRSEEFDIIHNHLDFLAFSFAESVTTPTLTTTHGPFDLPEIQAVYSSFPRQLLVSVSKSQQASFPHGRWLDNVYNGIALEKFRFRAEPGDYLVFLGRISPEKGVDQAIEISRLTRKRLILAAKVDPVDRSYYYDLIKPLIEKNAEFVSEPKEIDDVEKDSLLGGALACVCPVVFPEPFGLAMVEAMATGTPVVGLRAGSIPEVIVDGETGFVCDSVTEMVEAVGKVRQLDRRASRERVKRLFSATNMADGYEHAYAKAIDKADSVPSWPS